AVFRKKNLPIEFLVFDIDSQNNLQNALKALEEDPSFIGAAVTVPYKEKVISYLDAIDATGKCGAVNCIYRNASGKFSGMNTDGLGAIGSLKEHRDFQKLIRTQNPFNVLIWGAGGVAKAIAVSLLCENEFMISKLTVALRSHNRKTAWNNIASESFIQNRLKVELCHNIIQYPEKYDLIIQCTPVGSSLSQLHNFSPFGDLSCLESLATQRAVFFDVNYQPSCSLAMSHWKEIRESSPLNGLAMNRLQAVIAFQQVLKGVDWLNLESLSQQEISFIMKEC
ncbi:MAG: hypothetical protein HYS98_05105, partial [Deltaproteobacteria bacterium]|nr:hypothetical protein [Deltaproteobacteria bacterium]